MRLRWIVLVGALLVGLSWWWLVAGTPTDPPRSSASSLTRPSRSETQGASAAPHLSPDPKTPGRAHAASIDQDLTAPPPTPELYWQRLEELERTDRDRALAYALSGEEWYPETGKPAEARRAKIVTLLVGLNRMPEARERTRRFLQLYPQSPYRHLVQGVTGIHPRPSAPPRR